MGIKLLHTRRIRRSRHIIFHTKRCLGLYAYAEHNIGSLFRHTPISVPRLGCAPVGFWLTGLDPGRILTYRGLPSEYLTHSGARSKFMNKPRWPVIFWWLTGLTPVPGDVLGSFRFQIFDNFFSNFDFFFKFWQFFKILTIFRNFDFFSKCWQFLKILTIFQIFDNISWPEVPEVRKYCNFLWLHGFLQSNRGHIYLWNLNSDNIWWPEVPEVRKDCNFGWRYVFLRTNRGNICL